MRVPHLYLDTSVIGGFYDDEWQEPTRELWRQMQKGEWKFFTPAVTLDELAEAPERIRALFEDTFVADDLIALFEETEELATHYITQVVLTPRFTDDARHVAACTIAKLDYLVSWNFRHLVNVQREAGFNAVNFLQGYRSIH